MEQRIVAFIRFAEDDNEYHPKGYLVDLCMAIEKSIRFVSGENLPVFHPGIIQPGKQKNNRYKEVIEESIVFIPIINPRFFNDDKCRSHVEFFIQKEKERWRDDLIIPLYYQRPRFNDKDELMQIISERAPIEWKDSDGKSLRGQRLERTDIQEKLEKIASRVVDIYNRDVIRVSETEIYSDFIEKRAQDTTEKIKKIEDYLAEREKHLKELMILHANLREIREKFENVKNRIAESVEDIQRKEWVPLFELAVRNDLFEGEGESDEVRGFLLVKKAETTRIISDLIEKVQKKQKNISTEQVKTKHELGIEQQKHDYYISRLDFEKSIQDLHGEYRAKRLCERIGKLLRDRDMVPSYSEDEEAEFDDLVRDIKSDTKYYKKLLADEGFSCSETDDLIAGDSK